MSVATWPSELSCFTRGDYQAQPVDTRRRRLAGGPVGYSRRFSSAGRTIQLGIEVPLNLKGVFDDFYDFETSGGALPFRMPDPTKDGAPLLLEDDTPILDGSGEPILLAAEWLCLFGEEPPVEVVEGARYLIIFSVVVLP